MRVGQSDSELLGSDDAEMFGVFYERHLDAVVAFVGLRTRRADLVFDLVAETFARARSTAISTTSHVAQRWRGCLASRVIC